MLNKKKLGELCLIKSGDSNARDADDNGKYALFDRSKKIKKSKRFLFDCEALIIPGEGKEFLPRYYKGKFDLHQRAYAIHQFKPELNIQYLFYYLICNKDYFSKVAVGATVKSLRQRHFDNLEVYYPSLSEQQRVVTKLDVMFTEIDKAKIKNETKLIEIQNFLGNFIDKELKKLSLLFPTAQLNEFVEGVEYGSSKKCFKDGKYPVLRMGNIKNGQFILDDLIYTDDKDEAEKYKVRKNDVFFNRTNSPLHVGKTALSDEEFEGLFAGYLIRNNPKKEKLHSKFLNYYLNSPSIRKYGYSVMTSSVNQANINGSKLKQYPFISADIKTQSLLAKKFANIQTLTIQLEKLIKKTLENYNHLKSKIANQELRIKII